MHAFVNSYCTSNIELKYVFNTNSSNTIDLKFCLYVSLPNYNRLYTV